MEENILKKYRKFLSVIFMTLILILQFGGTAVNAAELDEDDSISINNIDINGYEYVHSSRTLSTKIDWQHYHSNPKSTTDTVSRSVSRTVNTTANVSVNSTFNAMTAKVGYQAEVGLGVSTTRTTTVTWTIPARSTYVLRYGSRVAAARGTENYWGNGRLLSSKSVNGNWTYMAYSDSIKQ